jgi:hypothetical protein
MTRTILIASAAYIEPDLEAEFGLLPPTFLPIGNRRLFVRQLQFLSNVGDRVLISLPEGFVVDLADLQLLHELGAEVVSVPPELTLGDSLVYVINVTASAIGSFAVLLGDTLLDGVDLTQVDVASVAPAPSRYRWGNVRVDGDRIESAITGAADSNLKGSMNALSGWFSFADPQLLVQAVTHARGDFLAAISAYSKRRPIRAIPTGQWLDFGHPVTYHQSRRRMTTEREFNRLETTSRTVIKSSINNTKIRAEAAWFEGLPLQMRIYAPSYLGSREVEAKFEYSVEYLHMPTLTDLFVFGVGSRLQWTQIFVGCDEFLSGCADYPAPPDEPFQSPNALYLDKTQERLETFAKSRSIDLRSECKLGDVWLPSLLRMAEISAAVVMSKGAQPLTLVHGDFCFSNILYDIRSDIVKVIDPRGTAADGTLSRYGDPRYDVGKLYHSVVGRYDHIVAGYYQLQKHGPLSLSITLPDTGLLRGIEAEFLERQFAGRTPGQAAAPAIGVLLFLSMLPLHADAPDRQDAFLANAMRLFLHLDRKQLSSGIGS